jgi:hypothetical protein
MALPAEMTSPVLTDRLAHLVARFASVAPFRDYVDPNVLLVVGVLGKSGPFGRHAACHFSAFRETRTRVSADGRFELPRITHQGRDVRYVISFTLPRFLTLEPREQSEVVMHELMHIHPDFDGSGSPLRHGPAYDRAARAFAEAAAREGITMDALRVETTAYYRRFRPFPKAYLRTQQNATRVVDSSELELAALNLEALS